MGPGRAGCSKLYRLSDADKEYWETWEEAPGTSLVHWGLLGDRGQSRKVRSEPSKPATAVIQAEIDELIAAGFRPIDPEDHAVLMIEYAIEGMGTQADVAKRHRLEQRMNETLGWTGPGACDGEASAAGRWRSAISWLISPLPDR